MPATIQSQGIQEEGIQVEQSDISDQDVREYFPIVQQIARSVYNALHRTVDYDDLYSAGMFGLLQAIEKFDPSQGISFKSYCRARIRGEMYDDLRRRDWIPRQTRKEFNQLRKAQEHLKSKLNRTPNAMELAEQSQLDCEKVKKMMDHLEIPKMLSLDHAGPNDQDETTITSFITDPQQSDPSERTINLENWQFLVRHLNRTEKLVVTLYYREELTLSQIGALLGVSESRICQIHNQALKRLKNLFQESEDLTIQDFFTPMQAAG